MQTWLKKALLPLLGLGFVACDGPTVEQSSVKAQETPEQYKVYKNMSFEDVCNSKTTYSATVQRTIELLAQRAGTDKCNDLYHAFAGKKLDLSEVREDLALGILVKLENVASLDLSGNNLTDVTQLQLNDAADAQNGNVTHGGWDRSLKRIDLSRNKLKDVTAVGYFKALSELQLAQNEIVNFEGFKTITNFVNPQLKLLNLAHNSTFTLPKNDAGEITKTSVTYRFVGNNALTYLDLRSTGLQSFQVLFGLKNLTYLHVEGVKATESKPSEASLFELSYLNARDSQGWQQDYLKYSQKLVYADFSGSDLASLNALNGAINLDILLLAQSKVSDFSALSESRLHPRYLSAYGLSNPTGWFGTDAPEPYALSLLDLQATTPLGEAPAASNTALDNCGATANCVQSASQDRRGLINNAFFCKKPLNADGSCSDKYATCDASTLVISYHNNDPKSPVKSICCVVPAGVKAELPGLGVIEGEAKPDGTSEICARFAASEAFFF